MLDLEYRGTEGRINFDRDDLRVCVELDDKLKSKIKDTAKEISKKNYPYDTLCWALAEFQLIFEIGHNNYSEQEVINKAEKIFDSSLKYHEICWLISILKVYLEEIKAHL